MEMKNMKRDVEQEKECCPSMVEENAYPYGLEIRLDHECMEKLGLEEMPEVGSKMILNAMVEVTMVSMSESKQGGEHCNMALQITDLALEKSKDKPKSSVQKVLYGEE